MDGILFFVCIFGLILIARMHECFLNALLHKLLAQTAHLHLNIDHLYVTTFPLNYSVNAGAVYCRSVFLCFRSLLCVNILLQINLPARDDKDTLKFEPKDSLF